MTRLLLLDIAIATTLFVMLTAFAFITVAIGYYLFELIFDLFRP